MCPLLSVTVTFNAFEATATGRFRNIILRYCYFYINSLIHLFTQLLICLLIYLFIYSPNYLTTYACMYVRIDSPTYLLSYLLTYAHSSVVVMMRNS